MISDEQAYGLAELWHGGQGSPLYSLTSTHTVHGSDHQDALIREIQQDMTNELNERYDELAALLEWVEAQQVDDGTSGQDRKTYEDDQDRNNYTVGRND